VGEEVGSGAARLEPTYVTARLEPTYVTARLEPTYVIAVADLGHSG